MEKQLLLFGFDTLPAILAVRCAAEKLGAEVVSVGRGDYETPLEELLGGKAGADSSASFPLGGKMILLCGLENRVEEVLEALAAAGVGRDCLKAVLTPHNRRWTARHLYHELQREKRQMQGGRRT